MEVLTCKKCGYEMLGASEESKRTGICFPCRYEAQNLELLSKIRFHAEFRAEVQQAINRRHRRKVILLTILALFAPVITFLLLRWKP